MAEITYPELDQIIEFNALAITMFDTKKADSSRLMSYSKLSNVLNNCKSASGDIYFKAAILLKGLVNAHAFESGNRRTAFIAVKYFIDINKGKFKIKDEPDNAKVMTGIREDFYKDNEIVEWIKNGKIRYV